MSATRKYLKKLLKTRKEQVQLIKSFKQIMKQRNKNRKIAVKPMNNIPPSIMSKIGQGLYTNPDHPICIIKEKIYQYCNDLARIEMESPLVSVENNFDRLRVPLNHPSRSPSDTFYQDDETVLRTHMTCYLYPMGKSRGHKSQLRYITCGDVYRKDAIDATHYPVFHQMDAFCIVPDGIDVKQDLRNRLDGLVKHLFGPEVEYQFLEDLRS